MLEFLAAFDDEDRGSARDGSIRWGTSGLPNARAKYVARSHPQILPNMQCK